jgi:hypothetical protein
MKGVWEEGAKENIWAKEGWGDGRMEETAELHDLHSSPSIIRIISQGGWGGGGMCANVRKEECVEVISKKARGKDATRKTKV